MNKSAVVGFLAGLAVLAVVGGAWYVMSGAGGGVTVKTTQGTPMPVAAVPAPSATPTPSSTPAPPAAAGATSTLTMFRNVNQPSADTADVELALRQDGEDPIRAIGIVENLPAGWTYDGIAGGEQPDLTPSAGREGKLEFAWFNIPKFPVKFTYRIKTATGAAGDISGQALYRTSGPELQTAMIATPLQSAGGGAPPAAPDAAAAPAPAQAAEAPVVEAPVEPAPMPAPAPEAAPAPAPAAAAAAPEAAGQGGLRLSQRAVKPLTPGGTAELEATLEFAGGDPVTAMAVVNTLPEGWVFEKITGGTPPAVPPNPGKTGEITFIWIQVPAFPLTFTYSVTVPAGAASADFVRGQAVYRRAGGEERSAEVVIEVPAAAP